MTRICLLVEVDDAGYPPQTVREWVENSLKEDYWGLHVELTAFEPAHGPEPYVSPVSIQAAWDEYLRVSPENVEKFVKSEPEWEVLAGEVDQYVDEIRPLFAPESETWEITTGASKYRIILAADGTGTITRLGGSSAYVPPEIANRAWDGEVFTFSNGRFVEDEWGERFFCDCELLSASGVIRDKRLGS